MVRHWQSFVVGSVIAFSAVTWSDLPASLGFSPYTSGHMDIGVRWEEGELVGFWKNDLATVNGQTTAPDYPAADLRALGIFDASTPPLQRPASPQWAFLGVEAGEDIYILPSSGVPNTLPYLGFSTEDDSLATDAAEKYRFTLVGMTGPANGVFSLYSSSANVPINTLDGEFPAGSVLIDYGDHLHFNWAFSQLGTYDLYFEFEALNGNVVIATGQDMFRFQITDGGGFDSYDHWRRTVFTPGQILDDAISGPSAVPLNNGINNTQRYVFGDNPSVEILWLEYEDERFPGVRAHIRSGVGDASPQVEFTPQLIPAVWTNSNLTLFEVQSVFHDPGMEIRTYRVEHPDTSIGFMRLRSTWSP